MIDLHCHILPGLDDGPDNLDGAVKIAKAAVKEGVKTIVATPHCYNGVFCSTANLIDEGCRRLNEELVARKVPLHVLPGSEIRITNETVQLWEENKLVGINGNRHILLLELPNLFILEGINLLIRRLVDKGIQPIIAHPERNPVVLKQPEVVDSLIYHGALMQITAGSLMGDFGRYSEDCAERMCLADQVAIVASDVHPGRKSRLKVAHKRLARLLGTSETKRICRDLPDKLVFGGHSSVAAKENLNCL